MKWFLPFALFVFTMGCRGPIVKPDLSDSWIESKYTQDRYHLDTQLIKVTNTATEGEYNREGSTNFSYNNLPIKIDEPTKKTVEDDITKYLKTSLAMNMESKIAIFIKIKEAKSFESTKMNGTVFIPVVGIFSGNDNKICISLNISFEIENDKHIVKKFEFVEKIEKETTTSTTREQNYKEIIRLYRQKLFEKIDFEILEYINGLKRTIVDKK